MDDRELIERAKRGEVLGNGQRQIAALVRTNASLSRSLFIVRKKFRQFRAGALAACLEATDYDSLYKQMMELLDDHTRKTEAAVGADSSRD